MEANRIAIRSRRTKLSDRAFDTFNILFMICLMIVTLYPFLNTLFSMQFKLFAVTGLLAFIHVALAFPKATPENMKRMFDQAASLHRKSRPEMRDGQVGRMIQYDPVPKFTGTKKIPGFYDVRPELLVSDVSQMMIILTCLLGLMIFEVPVVCNLQFLNSTFIFNFLSAGLNTLANHGYLPRK